jgi:hypothetical protein
MLIIGGAEINFRSQIEKQLETLIGQSKKTVKK